MKAITGFLTVIFGVMLLKAGPAQVPSVDQVLKNMEQGNAKYPSLQAQIQRREYKKAFDDLRDPSFGKIWILRTANSTRRIRIDFDKPRKEFFLVDKNSFKHYLPGTKEGETKSFSNEGQAEGECLLLGLCQSASVIQKNYDAKVLGEELVGNMKTIVLELKSKDIKRAMGISTVKLWLDPSKWIPVQTRIIQEHGNYTEAKYSNISTSKFSESVFNLNIPKDVKLLELK